MRVRRGRKRRRRKGRGKNDEERGKKGRYASHP